MQQSSDAPSSSYSVSLASSSAALHEGTLKYMIAGAAAGISEHTLMYPVDTIKTRMQALGHPGQQLHGSTVMRALRNVIKQEGIRGLYRGVSVMTWAGPSHALHFSVYEASKKLLGVQHEDSSWIGKTALAGACATTISDCIMVPADVVKQRMQLRGNHFRSVWQCVRDTWRRGGLGAFYVSYPTTMLMNIPYMSVHFTVYEATKKILGWDASVEHMGSELVAGGLAGGLAALVSNPLDVLKTRLQTQGVESTVQYSGLHVWRTLRQIIKQEGYVSLMHGVNARVLVHVPSAAICWVTYESIKKLYDWA